MSCTTQPAFTAGGCPGTAGAAAGGGTACAGCVGSGAPPQDASARLNETVSNTGRMESPLEKFPYDNPALRSSSTRDDDVDRKSSAIGVTALASCKAACIAAAFDAPNAATTSDPARASTGSVSVSRRAGGFGAS